MGKEGQWGCQIQMPSMAGLESIVGFLWKYALNNI